MAAFERATVGLILWWSAGNVLAADPSGVVSTSRTDVDETVERLEADARARGLRVVDQTDYTAEARRHGLAIPPVRVIQVARRAGHNDVPPVRYVIWRTPTGLTFVASDERSADGAETAAADADAGPARGVAATG